MAVSFSRRAFLFSALAGGAFAQQDPVFSTEVKVVNVLATVRNKKGGIVTDLGKSDFAIAENGHPQSIRYFARETDLPLTIGLMVDTSASQRKVIEAERGASFQFFDQVLRQNKDLAFIMQFDSAVQVMQALTGNVHQLSEALAYVDTETMRQLRIQNGGGTLLYDAVAQASKDIMSARQGRKALMLLTDGVDVGSYGTIEDAIEAAQRADTLVFSILYSDAGAYGFLGGTNGKKVLERISNETGGGFYEVSKKRPIEQIFSEIETELRSQYSLGYVSDQPYTYAQFRALRLTVTPKDLVVQHPQRYWAHR